MRKKMNVSVSGALLKRLSQIAGQKGLSIDALIESVLTDFADSNLEEALKKGYTEMGEINLRLAEICFEADRQQLESYEEKLSECE